SSLRAFVFVIPQVKEQIAIAEHLRNSLTELGEAIAGAEREIALFSEYRTRLIADVVTGKLDVRKVAARLPDEVDELEPLDDAEADTDVDADAADELDAISEEAEA